MTDRKITQHDLGKTFLFHNAHYNETFAGTLSTIERHSVKIDLGQHTGVFNKSDLRICYQIAKDCDPCAHGDCSWHQN